MLNDRSDNIRNEMILHSLFDLLRSFLGVFLLVKQAKQHEHVDHHKGLRQREDQRSIAMVHYVARMREDQAKLGHLAPGDPTLPRT